MSDKFALTELKRDNNITIIQLKDKDVVYIQLPEPDPDDTRTKREIQRMAHTFFLHLFEDYDVKIAVEHMPLNLTIITKKEEFVARLGDKIVEL
jgi:hypothetical protein